MSVASRLRRFRGWVPVPATGVRPRVVEWTLLDGNRLAIVSALLTFVFGSLMAAGTVWPFEMQRLLTETSTVQTVLNTFLSGIILLVSIVVSINAIVLSHDITSVQNQEDRVRGMMAFRGDLGQITADDANPSNPASFLRTMTTTINERARRIGDALDGAEGAPAESVREYVDAITESVDDLESVETTNGARFSVLWTGLAYDNGAYMGRLQSLRIACDDQEPVPESLNDRLDALADTLELFATGKEYFKTLYYTREISQLSRVLLMVSLPAILVTATAILAINAGLLPEVWILGLPPLQSFVATMFTIALAPYIVFVSYMLRLTTVARRTATGGVFTLT